MPPRRSQRVSAAAAAAAEAALAPSPTAVASSPPKPSVRGKRSRASVGGPKGKAKKVKVEVKVEDQGEHGANMGLGTSATTGCGGMGDAGPVRNEPVVKQDTSFGEESGIATGSGSALPLADIMPAVPPATAAAGHSYAQVVASSSAASSSANGAAARASSSSSSSALFSATAHGQGQTLGLGQGPFSLANAHNPANIYHAQHTYSQAPGQPHYGHLSVQSGYYPPPPATLGHPLYSRGLPHPSSDPLYNPYSYSAHTYAAAAAQIAPQGYHAPPYATAHGGPISVPYPHAYTLPPPAPLAPPSFHGHGYASSSSHVPHVKREPAQAGGNTEGTYRSAIAVAADAYGFEHPPATQLVDVNTLGMGSASGSGSASGAMVKPDSQAGPSIVSQGGKAPKTAKAAKAPKLPKAPKDLKAPKPPKPAPKEKRGSRVRADAPKTTRDRMKRAMAQRMFALDRELSHGGEKFRVLGSTGNVYIIHIGMRPTCDCPDCMKGNLPCKHIIFVFLKVLKVPEESATWYQKTLLQSEVDAVFAAAPTIGSSLSNEAPSAARVAYLKATGRMDEDEPQEVAAAEKEEIAPGRKDVVGDDCPVCFDEMTEKDVKGDKLVYDEAGCKNALHRECFNMWSATAVNKGDKVTCVYCRAPWAAAGVPANNDKGKGKAGGPQFSSLGYLNMADVAGMSRTRDTSSYYHGPMRGVRMWEKRYQDD